VTTKKVQRPTLRIVKKLYNPEDLTSKPSFKYTVWTGNDPQLAFKLLCSYEEKFDDIGGATLYAIEENTHPTPERL